MKCYFFLATTSIIGSLLVNLGLHAVRRTLYWQISSICRYNPELSGSPAGNYGRAF